MEEENKCENNNNFNGTSEFFDNVDVINFNNKKIKSFCDNLKLPSNLREVYLIHNELEEIPLSIMKLPNLKILDISYNRIKFFDDVPNFCHNIQRLNISNNKLLRPPYWIWAESPKNLRAIDLSYNENITSSSQYEYLEELVKFKTLVTEVKMNNCTLSFTNKYSILSTFTNVKHLQLGTNDLSHYSATNRFEELPCKGLEKCCNIEKLDLTNTFIYNINQNIAIFKNLQDINLSQNNLNSIPVEFCSLANLKVCILSMNCLLYLPDEFVQLTKLVTLLLDSNELCLLPGNVCDLPHLKKLDLYDNKLYDIPKNIENIREIDLAQNYFEEPEEEEYIAKRSLVRENILGRVSGCKKEIERPESINDPSELIDDMSSSISSDNDNENRSFSSVEDWDGDEYWIPSYVPHTVIPNTQWINFVKNKIAEGNFCPVDAHEMSVFEKVQLRKSNNPQAQYESDGQFDDFSEDDS